VADGDRRSEPTRYTCWSSVRAGAGLSDWIRLGSVTGRAERFVYRLVRGGVLLTGVTDWAVRRGRDMGDRLRWA